MVVRLVSVQASTAGVHVGDVVTRVDGEDAIVRLRRVESMLSGSTASNREYRAATVFMNGPIGSAVKLRIRGRDGRDKDVSLPRQYEDYVSLYHRERDTDAVRVLPGNIGYVDLDRLALDRVDAMFTRLHGSKAIIFDMRGYPNGTAWQIAPRLTSRQPCLAILLTPIVGFGPTEPPASEYECQRIAPTPSGASRYTGRTVMLIDERTQSQAEHTGLFLRAANGTKFIGTHTSGANGEITHVTLPGDIAVGFTGQNVSFPDGTQLQRVGLRPDVIAAPTIRGLQAGRDEVLAAALAYLKR